MSWFSPAAGLSDEAKTALRSMAESSSSEAAGVADILNTIAENCGGSETNEFLAACAQEVIDWAAHFMLMIGHDPEFDHSSPKTEAKL